jgi:hypothetical protein
MLLFHAHGYDRHYTVSGKLRVKGLALLEATL